LPQQQHEVSMVQQYPACCWWLQTHVDEGKHELNFNEFAGYAPKKQYHKLKESSIPKMTDGCPGQLLWIHKDAILTKNQKNELIKWADSLSREIKAKYNLPEESDHQEKINSY